MYQFSLPPALERALQTMNFVKLTPIQEATIPVALGGSDVVGCAQTGTGKTAAFAVPLLAKLLAEPCSRALILAPTRELAAQIAAVIRALSQYAPQIRLANIVGGASFMRQKHELSRHPSVLIATPGRLQDHINQRTIDLSAVTMVILDEADRMLDIGFAPQIDRIFKSLPSKRQTLLFSATVPQKIMNLAKRYMSDPKHIKIGAVDHPVSNISQSHVVVPGTDKTVRVLGEINTRSTKTLVFTRTRTRADRLARFLKTNGVKATAIHGNRSQSQRNKALSGFRGTQYQVLVATDVASRGLDVPSIELVINYDLPMTPEDYIHRLGRTARAGAAGTALSLVAPDEVSLWRRISKLQAQETNTSNGAKPRRKGSKPQHFWSRKNHKQRQGHFRKMSIGW